MVQENIQEVENYEGNEAINGMGDKNTEPFFANLGYIFYTKYLGSYSLT